MSSIFLSHSTQDNAMAARVRDWLKKQGHRSIFLDFDPEQGILAGRDWERELYTKLRECNAFIVLCSPHSMRSPWCFAEVTHARALGKAVFPLKVATCEIHPILQKIQTIDLTAGFSNGLEQLTRGLKAAGLDPSSTFDWDGSRPPFPGLFAFDEKDAAIFFGRDKEIREGLDTLSHHQQFGGARFVFMLGGSGSGKSSLLRAGLIPRLRCNHDRWVVVSPFRPEERPFENLAVALLVSFGQMSSSRSLNSLRERLSGPYACESLVEISREVRLERQGPNASVLLPIDQFEELFTLIDPEEANAFLMMLRGAVESPGSPLMVVATLRSDYLDDAQAHVALRDMSISEVRVNPLPLKSFGETIEKPASLTGLELEPGLTQAMVQDTKTDDALPLLAFAVRELWERRRDNRLTLTAYNHELGGLTGSVASTAERALWSTKALNVADEADLQKAFLSLVRVDEQGGFAKRPAQWAELPELIHPLLERLVRARLLVSRKRGETRILEVAHDALFRTWPRLTIWLNESREFLLWRERLRTKIAEWERNPSDDGTLLRGVILSEAERWMDLHAEQLSTPERAYINASSDLRKREQQAAQEQHDRELAQARAIAEAEAKRAYEQLLSSRKLKRLLVVVAGLLVVAVVIGILAYQARNAAVRSLYFKTIALVLSNYSEGNFGNARELLETCPPNLRHWEWFYLQSITDQRPVTMIGHTAAVTSVSSGPNSELIVSGSTDGTVRLWNALSGRLIRTLTPDQRRINGVAMSWQGNKFLSGGDDGVVRLWDLKSNRQTRAFGPQAGAALSVSLDYFEKHAAAGFSDGTAAVWDLESGRLVQSVKGTNGGVRAIALSGRADWMVLGTTNHTIGLWSVTTGSEYGKLQGHEGSVNSVAINWNESLIASGSEDTTVKIWNTTSKKELMTLRGHNGPVTSVAFTTDGSIVVSGSVDGTVRLWSTESGKLLRVLGGHTVSITSITIHDKYVFCGSRDNTISPIDINTGKSMMALSGQTNTPFDPEHGYEVKSIDPKDGWVDWVGFSPDSRYLVSAGFDFVKLWDLDSFTQVEGFSASILRSHSVTFDQTGQRIVSGSLDNVVRILDARSGKVLKTLGGDDSWAISTAVSPDGTKVLSGSWNGSVRIWDIDSGSELQVFREHKRPVESVELSPDGERLLSVGDDEFIVWSVRSGKAELRVRGDGDEVKFTSAVFSPNGKFIVSAGSDKTIKMWNSTSGKWIRTLYGHQSGASSVAVSPDSKRIVSVDWDGLLKLWDAETGTEILTLSRPGQERCRYIHVAFSRDGKRIAASGSNISLWSANIVEH